MVVSKDKQLMIVWVTNWIGHFFMKQGTAERVTDEPNYGYSIDCLEDIFLKMKKISLSPQGK